MGAHASQTFFQNFEVDTKIPKSPKLALITKILKKILKTAVGPGQYARLRFRGGIQMFIFQNKPRTHKICDIKNFFDKIWWFCENLEFGEIWNP